MPVYSTVESYLEKHHKKFLDLLHRVGVNTERLNTVIIPPDAEIEKWSKAIDSMDLDGFQKFTNQIYAHLFNKVLNEKTLSEGQNQITNALQQICKFTKLTNGKFEIHSGPDVDKPTETAQCEIDKNFEAAKDFKGISTKPIAVILRKSGGIATDGKRMEFKTTGSAEDVEEEMIEEAYHSFSGGVDNDKAIKAKCDNFKLLMSKGKHAFTECIAGLLVYLQKSNVSEFDSLKKVVASLLTYNAAATYIVLFQPYGKGSFIPHRLMTEEWCFAPARSSDYVKIFEDFAAEHAPKIDDGARKTALREARSGLTNVYMGVHFKKIYEQYFSKVFPSDFDLTCEQALWAHEALFKMCYADATEMHAEAFRGENYEEESTFTNPKYIKSCAETGVYSSDSLKCDCSPRGFVNSEYFLKYTIPAEPSCCKDEMSKHSNPLDATARAFCQINL